MILYYEPDEELYVDLSNPICCIVKDPQCVIEIKNNDPMPIVRIHETKKAEGDPCNPNKPYTTGYVKITLSQPAYGRESVLVHRMSAWHDAIYQSNIPAGEVADWD